MIGSTVSHYKIVGKLGEGGMGIVYEARDTRLHRTVALKFLSPELAGNTASRKRFEHEAMAASRLDHPNVGTIYEIDDSDDGRTFIAMAYYDGETLVDRIARGPLPVAEALRIAAQIASGLTAAHEQNIIHRDIKPANVLLTTAGQVKIVDFGLAKLAGQSRITRTGTTVGTVGYMSPEQARGDAVDQRTDVYSLGVILYEMLSGRRPYEDQHEAAQIYSILNLDPPPIASLCKELPPQVAAVVERAMAKDRNRRYATAHEMLDDLERLTMGERVAGGGRGRLSGRRGALLAILVLVAAALAVARLTVWPGGGATRTPFVIAVAPFWGTNAEALEDGKVMRSLVARELSGTIGDDAHLRVIADRDRPVPRSAEQAREWGRTLSASIVVWGEVLNLLGEVEIQPYITVVQGEPGLEPRTRRDSSLVVGTAEPGQLALRRVKAAQVGDVAIVLAARYYRHRDPKRALQLLGSLAPKTPEGLRLAASIYADDGRWDQAEAMYAEAAALAPDDPWPLIGLGWVRAQQGEWAEATDYFEHAIAIAPKNGLAHYQLGNVLANEGAYDQAFAMYRTAIELDPGNVWPRVAIGHVYRDQGFVDRAVDAYQAAADAFPKSAVPWLCLGDIAVGEAALTSYRRAAALEPDNPLALERLARELRTLGEYRESAQTYRRWIALEPANLSPRFGLAELLREQQKYEAAMNELQDALDLDVNEASTHLYLAYVFEATGDTTAAQREYETVTALDSTEFAAWIALGRLYERSGHARRARDAFARAERSDAESTGLGRFLTATSLFLDGHYAQAIDILERVVATSPDWDGPHYYLGLAFERAGQIDSAIVHLDTAARLGCITPDCTLAWALALHRAGRGDEATPVLSALADSLAAAPPPDDLDILGDVVRFYARRMTEKELLEKAADPRDKVDAEKKAVAYYYLGMAYLLGVRLETEHATPDPKEAAAYFQRCLDLPLNSTNAPPTVEMARYELGRLQS